MKEAPPVIDIAFNITDSQIKHLESILLNCHTNRVCPFLVGSNLKSSVECLKYSLELNTLCYIGLHPCDSNHFDDLLDLQKILDNSETQPIIAIGECGLDFDRLYNATHAVQHRAFEFQLKEFRKYDLPFFFHCRSATDEFIKLFRKYNEQNLKETGKAIRGVVHSFTDTVEEAKRIFDLGLYVSVNGLSLNKDKESGYTLIKSLPLEKMLVETDSPYCKLKDTGVSRMEDHVSLWNCQKGTQPLSKKKMMSQNEPARVLEVVEVISKVKGISVYELKFILFENCKALFGEGITEKVAAFFH